MEATALIATLGGALIACTGTVPADRPRRRHEDDRGHTTRSRRVYPQFILAIGARHARLRQIAATTPGDDHGDHSGGGPAERTRAAFAEAGVCAAREALFLDASPAVAAAGQHRFERLRDLRRAVADGATVTAPPTPRGLPPLPGLDAVGAYRAAVRRELAAPAPSWQGFGWADGNGLASCPTCQTGPPPP